MRKNNHIYIGILLVVFIFGITFAHENNLASAVLNTDIEEKTEIIKEIIEVEEQAENIDEEKKEETTKAETIKQTEPKAQPRPEVKPYRTMTMVATAYTDCPVENYPWGGYPSYIGLPLDRGIIAVDPNVIPMGTRLYIEGYGEGIAADQGGAIKGNRIDVFMWSKEEAYAWGIKEVEVKIYDQ